MNELSVQHEVAAFAAGLTPQPRRVMETDETAQAEVETEAQEATEETAAPEVQEAPKPAEAETISLAEARKLRSEAAQLRKRAKQAEAELETRREAELSEAEKATKRAEDAETRAQQANTALQQASLKADVAMAAADAHIKPDIALKLVRDDVTYDEDTGAPMNVQELVVALAVDHPELVDQGRASAGQAANANRQTDQTDPPMTDQDRLRRLYNRGNDEIHRHPERFGGGVVMPDESGRI